MSQVVKALKDKSTGKFVYFFVNPNNTFEIPGHDLVYAEVSEISSSLCGTCKHFSSCESGLRGRDTDCSSYDS